MDKLHFHYPSGTLKEHNLGQYGYSHVWELHSVKSVPIDDIIGSNDGTTKMTSSSPVTKDTIYCEHTYTPHMNCDIIPHRREHLYESPHTQSERHLSGISSASRNCSDFTSAYHELDKDARDKTHPHNTLDKRIKNERLFT